MLKSLLQGSKPQQPSEEEVQRKDPTKAFLKKLDKTFDQRLQTSLTTDRSAMSGSRPNLHVSINEDVPERLLTRKTEARNQAVENEKVMKKFDSEREDIRKENLAKARLEAQQKRNRYSEFEQQALGIEGQNEQNMAKRPKASASMKPISYNPLALVAAASAAKSKPPPRHDPNDIGSDPRFQMSLRIDQEKPQMSSKSLGKIGYNPLDIGKAPAKRENDSYEVPSASKPKAAAVVMTQEQLRHLEELRADPYKKIERRPPPVIPRPAPTPTQQVSIPNHPNAQQQRLPSQRPSTMDQRAHQLTPHQRPQPQAPQNLPRPVSQISKAVRPEIPGRGNPLPRPSDVASITTDLMKLRRHPFSEETAPPLPAKVLVSRMIPEEKPKVKKINPKSDPNCIFCFRCQEYHHKDKHLTQGPTLQTQIAPRPHAMLGKQQAVYTSKSSKPTPQQIAEQKALLEHALGKRQVQPTKRPRDQDSYEEDEGEDEDNYDVDDDFIDNDDDKDMNFKKHLRKITRYNPEAYDDADFDDRLMEVRDYETLEREDQRSRAYGRFEEEMEEQFERKFGLGTKQKFRK